MTRGRLRRGRESPTEADEAQEEDQAADESDPESDPDSTSLDDLTLDADMERFDRTFRITKRDVPAGIGDEFPIPQPWQGIPRVAVTINLNYVYDEANDEWVRQGPFEGAGGGGVTLLDSGTTSLADTSQKQVPTSITTTDIVPATALRLESPTSGSRDIIIGEADISGFTSGVNTIPIYNQSAGQWEVGIRNDTGTTVSVSWFLYDQPDS